MATSVPLQQEGKPEVRYLTNQKFSKEPPDTELVVTDHNAVVVTLGTLGGPALWGSLAEVRLPGGLEKGGPELRGGGRLPRNVGLTEFWTHVGATGATCCGRAGTGTVRSGPERESLGP